MKLTEIKKKTQHYFEDEQGRIQGQYNDWWSNGQMSIMALYRDGKIHGEYKWWNSLGILMNHAFVVNNKEIVDFLKNPELYPYAPEEKTMFVLKYGNAPFISEGENE